MGLNGLELALDDVGVGIDPVIRGLFVQGVVTRQLLGIEGEYDAARKKSSRQKMATRRQRTRGAEKTRMNRNEVRHDKP